MTSFLGEHLLCIWNPILDNIFLLIVIGQILLQTISTFAKGTIGCQTSIIVTEHLQGSS